MAQKKAPPAQPSDAPFDNVLLEESDGHEEGAAEGEGLELDDSQATEIRQIFLTTLPQYLEPVEQMLDQLFSADAADPETHKALLTTLSSIAAAATRIGIDDIHAELERMHVRLEQFDGATGLAREDLISEIQEGLGRIKKISSGDQPEEEAPRERAQTIVAAFQNITGIDKSALEKLTAAGLVTVDQLKMARLDEIVAVTGLDQAVVRQILNALAGVTQAGASDPNLGTVVTDGKPKSAAELRAELETRLHTQVELEASLDELRAEIMKLRIRTAELREQCLERERERDTLRLSLSQAGEKLVDLLTALSKARARQGRLEGRTQSTEERLAEVETRLSELRKVRRSEGDERSRVESEVASLVTRVRQMIHSTQLGAPVVTAERRLSALPPAGAGRSRK